MIMWNNILDGESFARALSIRDLSDEAQGAHSTSIIVRMVGSWRCYTIGHRATRIVSIQANYHRLHYQGDGFARDARYTRYVSDSTLTLTLSRHFCPLLMRTTSGAPPLDLLPASPG